MLAIGSISYHDLILANFKDAVFLPNNHLNSYFLGLAGLSHFKNDSYQEDLLPCYLKKPQAQVLLEEKSKNIEIIPMTKQHLNLISDILLSDFDEFWSYSILEEELDASNSNYFVSILNR